MEAHREDIYHSHTAHKRADGKLLRKSDLVLSMYFLEEFSQLLQEELSS